MLHPTLSSVTAGDTLLIDTTYFNTTSPVLTDSNTGTIATVLNATGLTNPADADGDAVFVVKNAGAGIHILTITFAGAPSYPGMTALEITGASATSPVDGAANGEIYPWASGCAGASMSTARDLLVSFISVPGGGGVASVESTAQVMTPTVSGSGWADYGTAPSAGSSNVGWSLSGNYGFCDVIALH